MDPRFHRVAAIAAEHHSVVSTAQLAAIGVDAQLRWRWTRSGSLIRLGPRSFTLAGSAPTWHRSLAGALADLGGVGLIAGRAAAQLHGLDGFTANAVECLVERRHRRRVGTGVVVSTELTIGRRDTAVIDGLRVLRPERLILDSPLFNFTKSEIENAIDSAIRLRLLAEDRLRASAAQRHRRGINGGRALLDALIDTGGESGLERMFLRLVRAAGLPQPETQRTYREGSSLIARVDFRFPDGLIVEVNGHGPHGTRQQRQRDEQRRTRLVLLGHRVITFTYDDVRYRPDWVVAQLTFALGRRAA